MRFGVVGDPVDHSRSPAIHRAAFSAVGIDATYDLLPTPAGALGDVVRRLRSGALDGVNVTMPHKDGAFAVCDRASASAERTLAVNTMVIDGGSLIGHNTDVDGVRHAHRIIGAPDGPILVLGSGGAARAALVALEDHAISIASRRTPHADAARRITGIDAETVPWGTAIDGAVLVNATPLGMAGEHLPEEVVCRASAVIDMAYGMEPTPAITWAVEHGRPTADGLDMLVGQAATAFTLFTGHPAPLEAMADAARR